MLRKTVYILLMCAIIINIGSGIVYNGIPAGLKHLIGTEYEEVDRVSDLILPPSRSGDVYVTSFNMTVNVGRTDDHGEEDNGSITQTGTMTRSILLDETLTTLFGTQRMIYRSNDTGDLLLRGDFRGNRHLHLDRESGSMSEDRGTTIEMTGFPGATSQTSRIDTTLKRTRGSWEEILWRALIPGNRTLINGTTGSLDDQISLDEIGVLIPRTSLRWNVIRTWNDPQGTMAEVRISNDETVDLDLDLIFSDGSPYPISMDLSAVGSYPLDGGVIDVDLRMSEDMFDLTTGSGSEISWSFGDPADEAEPADTTPMKGMVIEEGSGESSFQASPRECLDLAVSDGSITGRFIDQYGGDHITTLASRYFRSDNGSAGSRIWNITLVGPMSGNSAPACSFEVIIQGTPVMDRKRMELLSETEFQVFEKPSPGRNMISLNRYEDLLGDAKSSDHFFISHQLNPSLDLKVVNRGNNGTDPFSTLLFNLLGMEREHGKDLFISHVQDTSGPKKTYVVVIDGNMGEILSETEISGPCTILFNSHGTYPV